LKSFKVESNNITIQTYEHSYGDQPVIFLHYMGGSSLIWGSLIPYFISNYRVITLDLRGHGQSDQPETGYDIETMVEDVMGVLDFLNINKSHFIGSSLGCYVGTRLASLYPERVLSLVNSEGAIQNNSGPHGRFKESKEEFLKKYFSEPETTFLSREEYLMYLKENWTPWNYARRKVAEQTPLRELSNGKLATKTSNKTLYQIASNLFDIQLEDWYKTVNCPVLFLPAEKEGDLNEKLRFIHQIEKFLPYSKIEIIANSTHAMMFDHEKEFSYAINRFYNYLKDELHPWVREI